MSQTITATFVDGVLKPDEPLDLPAGARVRLIVEPVVTPSPEEADKVWAELENLGDEFDRISDEISVDSGGKLPTRDELHDRR
jgi:predicted DNA-binding antitoxin AbrB/MazE fold protein